MPRFVKDKPRPNLDRLDIPHIVDQLGIRVKNHQGGWITAWCIFHDDVKTPNLRIREDHGGTFRCLACNSSGNILHLVERKLNVDRAGAWKHLAEGRKSTPTAESIKRELDKRKDSGVKSIENQIERHILRLCYLVTPEPSRLSALGIAHVAGNVDRWFMLIDPDEILLQQLVDHLMVTEDDVLFHVGRGDADAYAEFMDDVGAIWNLAESTGYLKRHPIYFKREPVCALAGKYKWVRHSRSGLREAHP